MDRPGTVSPVPVPRDLPARDDGRIDLLGLPQAEIRAVFEDNCSSKVDFS